MKPHIRNYIKAWSIGEQDQKLCEVHRRHGIYRDAQIHHITPRKMGGGKAELDEFWNLIGLCQECHDRAEGRSKKGDKFTREELYLLKLWPHHIEPHNPLEYRTSR
jgi:5-methylcytosine-specific restriction endonuclease McrA